MALYCPVSGVGIKTNPKWINQKVSETFTANFWIINDSILYSLPKGYADLKGVQNSLDLNDTVAEEIFNGISEYIQIEDYSFLDGSSSEARKYLTNKMDLDKRRLSLIFCNLSNPLYIAVKIKKRFITTGKKVKVVRNYKNAVTHALKISNQESKNLEIEPKKIFSCYPKIESYLTPVDLKFSSSWNIDTPEYTNKMMVIDNYILHSTSNGSLSSKHIPLIDRTRSQCQADLPKGSAIRYIVVDSSKIVKGTRKVRIQYMQSLKTWHQNYPISMYILYGANTFLKTALQLARAMVPFKVNAAKNLCQALQLVHDDQYISLQPKVIESAPPALINQKDIEKLVAVVGRINWQQEGFENDFDIDEDNPLYFLYQSIKLIKEELDDLFRERKQLEKELIQSRKLESIGTLTGGIAHDFNNILQIISGSTELALADLSKDNPIYANLNEIKDAGQRASDIVKHLLTFSRKSDQKLEKIEAVSAINESCKFLRSVIPATIEIRKNMPKPGITIFADPIQINQLMMNICTNATQAMEVSGGVLDIKLEKTVLYENQDNIYSDLNPGNYLKVTISDTGPGIDPKIIDRIFDPYFTTKEVSKGTGFGLAIVHKIVRTHNGVIKAESEPGKGATFTIYFPVSDERIILEKEVPLETSSGKETILCIDDDKTIIDITEQMLSRLGYNVIALSDPIEALELFKLNPDKFDLVITDMTMPGMDGSTLMSMLKKIRFNIPVVISTGFSTLIDEKEAKKRGAAGYISKPFLKGEISKIIRSVLDNN
ncbi:MAG: response regulator [Calditrichaeota bacterium]|nr:MAG: response regulator [Calditrichota bacterium]MBL1204826.1 response regulator [Calditrichota bacterium]NOG44655.1 response regulator [Calditrichota bacterium]